MIRDPDLDLEARAVATNALGISYFNENQPEPAIASHAESAEIARNLRHPRLEAAALIGLARVEYHLKRQFDSAQRHLEDALRIGRAEGDEKVIADAQRNLGVVLWWGKSEVERPLTEFYEPALSAYRRLGDRHGESSMPSNIGLIHSFRGDLYAHMDFQESALAIREEIGDEAGIADSFKLLGSAYLGVGNVRKAREFFEKSFQISSRIGYRLNQNEAETYLAGSLAETGDFDGAIRLFTNVYERERESPELAKNRLASIGSCYLFKGDLNNAQQVYERNMGSYPTTHQELWSRLLQFQFDEPGTALPFSRRLARENSWGQRHTIRVIQEYRLFLFLAMTAGHPVTPSVDVDQAWHLHLTYTRSYWDELCPKVLCGRLHHQPTKGGNKEGAKFQDWYARTLQSYQAAFGVAPPADIWPAPAVRLAAESRIRQVSSRTHWVIRKPAVGAVGIVVGVAP